MPFPTTRFGPLEIADDRQIHFPLGLLGFERCHRFALIDAEGVAPMRWLQSLDVPELAFLVVEPALFFANYAPKLSAEDRKVLDLAEGEEPVAACIVTVPDDPAQMTVNLLGPLVFNDEKRLGKQVVLQDAKLSTKHRLIPDGRPTPELVSA